jgi:hypothetical protein
MKSFKYLLLLVSILVGITTARADTVSPYAVDFNTAISTSDHGFKVSTGWGHVVESYTDEYYDTYYVTYTYSSTGGVENSGCLKIGTQDLGSGYETQTVKDALVTPALTGAASIYVKKSSYSGSIKFYTVTNTNGTYKLGSQIADDSIPALNDTTFVKVSLPVSTSGQQIAIIASKVYIDNFAAQSADIVRVSALKITKVISNNPTYSDADASGNVNVAFKALVQNVGDVELKQGDTNYSLSIINVSSNNDTIVTVPITQTLAVGATSDTISIAGTFNIAKYPARDKYNVKENVSGTNSYGAWIEPIAYKPVFSFCTTDDNTALSAPVNFGLTKKAVTRNYRVRNTGGAPLNITTLSVPEGFSASVAAPFTVAPHSEKAVDITLLAETPGVKSGNLVIKGDSTDYALALKGIVVDTTKWYVDFEDNKLPGGCIAASTWSVANVPQEMSLPNNNYCAAVSLVDSTKFISPLLEVGSSDSLVFEAARRSSSSFVNVYYSADRKNWIPVREINCTAEDNADLLTATDNGGYGSSKYYLFKQFTVNNIPAGKWYLAFESGYAYVDNFYGYKVVSVDHDVLIDKQEIPATGTVNHKYTAKVTLKNVNTKAESDTAYTAKFYVIDKNNHGGAVKALVPSNGEEVTGTPVAIAAGDTATVKFDYTPHSTGNYKVIAEFSFGSYVVATDSVNVTFNVETSSNDVQVGTVKGCTNAVPLNLYYNNSESETIYTAKLLGLKKGDKITKISYKGYNTSDTITTHVKVWISNTTDSVYSSAAQHDTTTMKKVYDAPYKFEVAGTEDVHADMLVINLDSAFVYDGTNICINVLSNATKYKKVNFEYDNTVSNQTIGRQKDSNFETATYSTKNLPVVHFAIATEPTVLSGTIISASDHTPIAGALITLVSKEEASKAPAFDGVTDNKVVYTAYTSSEGDYTLNIVQNTLDYIAVISAEGYVSDTVEISEIGGISNIILNDTLAEKVPTAVNNITAGGIKVYGVTGAVIIKTPADAKVKIYNLLGRLVTVADARQGENRVELPQGIYIVERNKVIVK